MIGLIALVLAGLYVVRAGVVNRWAPQPTVWAGARALVFLVLTAVALDGVLVVPTGHRAVVFSKVSGLNALPLGEGLHFVTPLITKTATVDIRIQKVEFEASAASKDLQDVSTKIALNYEPSSEKLPLIVQQYGLGYEDKVIHPAVQEALKSVTARYTAEELITRRDDVKREVQKHLAALIAPANLRLLETYITDFSFSEGFSKAIESKQIAEQDALKAKRDLDRIRIEAEQKVAQARAEAQSLMMQREAITPQLLELRRIEAQLKAIEKWNGEMPGVIMGGGSTPLIDLSKLTGKN